jgi:carbon storage regulator
MLVLTRKRNETVVIHNFVEVTVLDIKEGRVRLGIKAPKEVSVDRKEVRERKKREAVP